MLRGYKGTHPTIGARVYVDVSAQLIVDVTLGDDASVWMNAVLRGDVNRIVVGARANVQDNCVLHGTAAHATLIAVEVTVGHSVTLHGCTVERRCLIGIGAIVLNGAVVGEQSIVAAGTLVPEGMRVPPPQPGHGSSGQGSPTRHRGGTSGAASLLRELRRVQGRLPCGGDQ